MESQTSELGNQVMTMIMIWFADDAAANYYLLVSYSPGTMLLVLPASSLNPPNNLIGSIPVICISQRRTLGL